MSRYGTQGITSRQTNNLRMRQKVLALIPLQAELLRLLKADYEEFQRRVKLEQWSRMNNGSAGHYARERNLAATTTLRLLKGETVTTEGETMRNICIAINRPDLAQKIEETCTNLQSRYKSLAAYNVDTVNLVFSLLDTHLVHFGGFSTTDEFAEMFDEEYRETVQKALNLQKEGLQVLSLQPLLGTESKSTLRLTRAWQSTTRQAISCSNNSHGCAICDTS